MLLRLHHITSFQKRTGVPQTDETSTGSDDIHSSVLFVACYIIKVISSHNSYTCGTSVREDGGNRVAFAGGRWCILTLECRRRLFHIIVHFFMKKNRYPANQLQHFITLDQSAGSASFQQYSRLWWTESQNIARLLDKNSSDVFRIATN